MLPRGRRTASPEPRPPPARAPAQAVRQRGPHPRTGRRLLEARRRPRPLPPLPPLPPGRVPRPGPTLAPPGPRGWHPWLLAAAPPGLRKEGLRPLQGPRGCHPWLLAAAPPGLRTKTATLTRNAL